MRRPRIAAVLGLSAIVGMVAGCETMGWGRNRPAPALGPAEPEPATPEGSVGRSRGDQRRGAWSSDAADIEKSLMRRSASADW